MKNQLPLIVLLTLVACGGSGGPSKSKPASGLEMFTDALNNQEVGTVTTSRSELKSHELQYNSTEQDYEPVIDSSLFDSKIVVIKVDGDNVYTYSEHRSENHIEKMVSVNSKTQQTQEFQEELEGATQTTDGSKLRVIKTIAADDMSLSLGTSEASITGGTVTSEYTFNLTNPLCGIESLSTTQGQIFQTTKTGMTKNLDPLESKNQSTCAPKLELSEVRTIDLSEVTFCDFTKVYVDDAPHCKDKQNMNVLTSDL